MARTPQAATDLSREILGDVLDERGKPGSDPQPPATTLAEQIQAAIDRGSDLDSIQRRFHLSESELSDYCSDIMDEGGDADWSGSADGY